MLFRSIAHPHSSIIQLLLAFGPIGLLIPSYFFFVLTKHIIKADQTSQLFYLVLLSTLILSVFDGILYHAYGLFISSIIAGICIALAWPASNKATENQPTQKIFSKAVALALTIAISASASYSALFIYQLYYSQYGVKTEQWINWNARYPLYFSETWNYQRYKTEEMELLKQRYIERLY